MAACRAMSWNRSRQRVRGFGGDARMTSRRIDGYYGCELLLPLP